jgi:lipopolysaccharide/colanic/teichoic acid biosynthesis glycosyltransferase
VTSHLQQFSLRSPGNGTSHAGAAAEALLSREFFAHTLYVERKRSERSGRSFVLMLLESSKLLRLEGDQTVLHNVLRALSQSIRDTDVRGWYQEGSAIGLIFTELGDNVERRAVAAVLLIKVTRALAETLTTSQLNEIKLTCHVYPEEFAHPDDSDGDKSGLYDDLLYETAPKRLPRAVKRFMDIAGSLCALILGLPLFMAIAMAIKLTSKGPVFFRQQRLGQYGRGFTFLKFRSMHPDSDPSIHREYVKRFIGNGAAEKPAAEPAATYKLTVDPRVTPIGRFLRRTSLDELPQFLNVLWGDMSLVGPRPPVPYEVECYSAWHRTRLLAAKPGITGLWQVAGRSRVKFDDMVRMDLRYATSWSLWLDLKILLQTPLAVFTANGAH